MWTTLQFSRSRPRQRNEGWTMESTQKNTDSNNDRTAGEGLAGDLLLSAHLWLRYGNKPPVLRDVDLDIRRGEVLGLVGQSGSGKSTLAMALLGLLDKRRAHVEGTIRFDGADLL